MQHLTIKAAATTTSKGVFSAIAAAYSVDRMNERIIPGAFEKTILAWQTSGKQIPLHWDHSGDAADIIGYIDPTSMKETDEGLYVEGKLDIKTSDVAREAWRSMKNNAVALSFGYLPKTRKGKDGVTELTEVDLFEVSIVPGPANPDTRILSLKSTLQAQTFDDVESVQKFLDDKFPGHKISAVEDEATKSPEAKSAPQDPLVQEAWKLVLPRPTGLPTPEPEPEPEPLDAAKVQGEAWALVMKPAA